MKSKIALSLMAIVVAATMIVSGTMAYFTDTSTQSTARFQAGNIDVATNMEHAIVVPDSLNDIMPGDVMSEPIVITVDNIGKKALGWFGKLSYTGDDQLINNLYIYDMRTEIISKDKGSVDAWTSIENGVVKDGFDDKLYIDGTNKLSLAKYMSSLNTSMDQKGVYQFMGALLPGNSFKVTLKLGMYEEANSTAMNAAGKLTFQTDALQYNQVAIERTGHGYGDIFTVFMEGRMNAQK